MIKLLIVEDEILIRRGIITMLERGIDEPVQCMEAGDGLEAMQIYQSEMPDIIITDIRMPDCDGLELIQNIQKQTASPPLFMILSGHSDFAYAKQALRLGVNEYLLKPVDRQELIDTVRDFIRRSDEASGERQTLLEQRIRLQEAAEDLRRLRLCELVSGEAPGRIRQITSGLMEWNIDLHASHYVCVAIDYIRDGDVELKKFSIENICEEVVQNIASRCEMFFDESDRFIVIVPGEEAVHLRMLAERIARKCRENLKRYLNMQCFAGIGALALLAVNIHRSYRQALDALGYKLFDAEMGVQSYEKMALGSEIHVQTDWRFVLETLNEKGEQEALSLILTGQVLVPSIRTAQYLENQYKMAEKKILSALTVPKGTFVLGDFEDNWSMGDYRKRLLDFMHQARQFILNGHEPPRQKLIYDMRSYIMQHLQEDINLNMLAAYFGYNASYISALFKKEMNFNFSDYIRALRIAKAKQLMTDSRLSLKQIAEATGYSNVRYFGVVFKKETGVTPAKFRNEVAMMNE